MNEEYKIRFTSLKEGFHNFNYTRGKECFEQIEYSEIKNADIVVSLELEKKSTMMLLNFEIKGKVEVMCDRCTDTFFIDIESDDELIYQFGEEDVDDDKVIVIFPNEIEINISHPVYECISLAIPSRRLHDSKKDCNQDMIKEISNYLLTEEDNDSEGVENNSTEKEIDPRWSELNKLKNKN
jgi:uncharacterized metal-binding protein YceD (DUF177 family)